ERLLLREAEAHAAFFAGFLLDELALAAAAGVDLRFHHPERTRQRVDRSFSLVQRSDRHAPGDRSAEGLQDFLRLMLMNVHEKSPLERCRDSGAWVAIPHGAPRRNVAVLT